MVLCLSLCVCSHYLCGGSCTSSGEGGVPENEVLRFTEGEGTIVWTRVMNSVFILCLWICVMNLDLLTLTIQVLSIILDTVTICHCNLFKCNLLEELLKGIWFVGISPIQWSFNKQTCFVVLSQSHK